MAYTTASSLIDAVRTELDNTAGSDTLLLQLVNSEHLRLQREHDFSFQEQAATRTLTTSASGFARFAQPTDAKELITLYYIEASERKELNYLPFYDALAAYPDPSEANTPEAWSLFRNEVYIFPALNSAIAAELYYTRFLADFTATASNDFLVWGSDALRYGTARAYAVWHGDQNRASYYQALLADAVTSLLKYHRASKLTPTQSTSMRTPGTVVGGGSRSRLRSLRDNRW